MSLRPQSRLPESEPALQNVPWGFVFTRKLKQPWSAPNVLSTNEEPEVQGGEKMPRLIL
jgi:hypothetical protein